LYAGRIIGLASLALSVMAGAAIATQAFGMDERASHVYALSLPVTRARFLGTRAITAGALLGLPALAIWIGGMITVGQVEVPPALRGYPGALAVRVLLAAWLAHSLVFALRYAAGRRARVVFFVLLVAVLGAAIASAVAPGVRGTIAAIGDFLVTHPGPLGIFFGRWTLFDV
jgi:hypothetical protein